jgi:hypothetical protein
MVIVVRPSRPGRKDVLKRRRIRIKEEPIAYVATLFSRLVNQFLLAPFALFATNPFAISTRVMSVFDPPYFIRL